MDDAYQARRAQELSNYRDVVDISGELPSIHAYFSARYLEPKLTAVGVRSLASLYSDAVVERCAAQPDRDVRVVSFGSGNGELEVQLLETVRESGVGKLTVTCLEMNGDMRARTRELAGAAGVLEHLRCEEEDLNTWVAAAPIDVAIASHSLHHVVELEHLFDQIVSALRPDGVFLINDMIGRNGHMRWPEALQLLEPIWAGMPARYKYNHQLRCHDEIFVNRDCSVESFEGIRAQDILPLLLQRFCAERFCVFGNVIDVFVDRGYGPNLDPERAEDCEFVDRVAQLGDLATDLGLVKPTQMIASFRPRETELHCFRHWTPRFSVRDPAWSPPRYETPCSQPPPDGALLDAELSEARAQLARVLGSKTWRWSSRPRAVLNAVRRAVR